MLFVLYPEFLDIIRGEKDCNGLKSILDSTRSLHTLLFLCIRHIFFFPPSFKKDTFASYKILSTYFLSALWRYNFIASGFHVSDEKWAYQSYCCSFEGKMLLFSYFKDVLSGSFLVLSWSIFFFIFLLCGVHRVSWTSVSMSCIISGISSDIRSLRNTCFCWDTHTVKCTNFKHTTGEF